MLAGLDEAAPPVRTAAGRARRARADRRDAGGAARRLPRPRSAPSTARQDVVFDEEPEPEPPRTVERPRPPPALDARAGAERPDHLVGDRGRGRQCVQRARPDRAGAERQDARGPREGDAAADAAALARQQPADTGRASGARRRSSASRAGASLRTACGAASATPRTRIPDSGTSSATTMKIGGAPARSMTSEPAATPIGLPDIERGGEQRDRGAARLRRHLRGVGLQRVVQHVEAEPDRRRPRRGAIHQTGANASAR